MKSAASSKKRRASQAPAPAAKRANPPVGIESPADALLKETATSQASINARVRAKKASIREKLGSDPLLDIFVFLSRSDLDTLQMVDASFHDIIAHKMSLLCVRRLNYASISRTNPDRVFMLVHDVKDGQNNVRFPTGKTEEFPAFMRLLSACRSATIDFLQMCGTESIQSKHIDALTRYTPLIVGVRRFSLNGQMLAEDISQSTILRTLDSFVMLEHQLDISGAERYNTDMQKFFLRRGDIFQAGL